MTGQQRSGAAKVDAYLANAPDPMRATLQDLRRIIRAAAPQAEEVISYGIPAFRQDGVLVFYAAFRDHCSFFPGSVLTTRKFAAELKPFAVTKGTVHFTPERPLPAGLVTRIVKARVAENHERALKRARPASRRSHGRS